MTMAATHGEIFLKCYFHLFHFCIGEHGQLPGAHLAIGTSYVTF